MCVRKTLDFGYIEPHPGKFNGEHLGSELCQAALPSCLIPRDCERARDN